MLLQDPRVPQTGSIQLRLIEELIKVRRARLESLLAAEAGLLI